MIKTPIKAIRAKCLDCCCDSFLEVRLCSVTECPLFPYRLGHRPKKDTFPTVADDVCEKRKAPTPD